jgi:hypothetical protein
MSSHSYEVALFGEFYSQDLKAILNRITLHSESSQPFQSREILFDPVDAQAQRDSGTEPVLLRAKKEISDPKATWSVANIYPLPRPEILNIGVREPSLHYLQGTFFLSKAGVRSCTPRSYCKTMGNMSSHWRCFELCGWIGICVSRSKVASAIVRGPDINPTFSIAADPKSTSEDTPSEEECLLF